MRLIASWFSILPLAGLAAVAAIVRLPDPSFELPPRTGPPLASARSWGYQLQHVDPSVISDDIDMMVVDHSRDGTAARAFSRADVEALRRRRNGTPRIVLCYLSIGEAENYRGYWDRSWTARPPEWLGAENPAWRGNFAVSFWLPAWQRLIFQPGEGATTLLRQAFQVLSGRDKPYLDQILEAGFDGVYLDRVDAFEKALATRPSAREEMIAFVAAISAHAKARRPGFLVVPQNAEELLVEPRYQALIDGAAKEDLYYGEAGDGIANPPPETRHSIGLLNNAKTNGLPVFVVEYLDGAERQRESLSEFGRLGFIALFAERGLKQPPALPLSAPSEVTIPIVPSGKP